MSAGPWRVGRQAGATTPASSASGVVRRRCKRGRRLAFLCCPTCPRSSSDFVRTSDAAFARASAASSRVDVASVEMPGRHGRSRNSALSTRICRRFRTKMRQLPEQESGSRSIVFNDKRIRLAVPGRAALRSTTCGRGRSTPISTRLRRVGRRPEGGHSARSVWTRRRGRSAGRIRRGTGVVLHQRCEPDGGRRYKCLRRSR